MEKLDLEQVFAEGYLAAGVNPANVARHSKAGAQLVAKLEAAGAIRKRGMSLPWTLEDDERLKLSLGFLTEEEIGKMLGRSATAVHIRAYRDLKLAHPSKAPDVITANRAAALLGQDAHKVTSWCDRGLIPSRVMAGARTIRLIECTTFRRWVLNPDNWIWFDVRKVRDRALARMLKLRAKRWGDGWWTTRQVADHHGVEPGDVKRYLQDGRLSGVQAHNRGGRDLARWANWFVKRSDAVTLTFIRGRGAAAKAQAGLTRETEAFLILAASIGLSHVGIGRMFGMRPACVAYALKGACRRLKRKVRWLDWRDYALRFPSLMRAMAAFRQGKRLSNDQRDMVRSVLTAWCRRCRISRPRNNATRAELERVCKRVHRASGLNPVRLAGRTVRGTLPAGPRMKPRLKRTQQQRGASHD